MLTSAQSTQVSQTDLLARQMLLSARRTIALMRMFDLSAQQNATTLSGMAAGDLLPTTTGLAGAVPVSQAQILALQSQCESLIAAWDTAAIRATHAEFVGPANIDGQM